MPKGPNQKKKLLILQQLLLERTDEAHPMTIRELIGELARWDVQAERQEPVRRPGDTAFLRAGRAVQEGALPRLVRGRAAV